MPWLGGAMSEGSTAAVRTQKRPLTQAEGGQGRLSGGGSHLHGSWRKSGLWLATVIMSAMAALKVQRVVGNPRALGKALWR